MSSPAPRMASNEGVIDAVKAAIGDAFVDARDSVGEISVAVVHEKLVDAMIALRDTPGLRSEEHTSELQSLMRISYAVFCLKKKKRERENEKQHGQSLNN